MEWYYADGDKQLGPINATTFEKLVQNGTIQAATLVWNSALPDWTAYGNMGGVSAAQSPAPPQPQATQNPSCTECGRALPEDEMARYGDSWVCPACKPVFIQKIKEGVRVGSSLEYAGFWIRFGAKFIDGLILWAIMLVTYLPFMFLFIPSMMEPGENPENMGSFWVLNILMSLFQIILPIIFATWFVGKYGATPGKMACRLKVVTSDGGKVTYMRALGRALAEIISYIILLIGYIMAAFDGQKRALHDHICNTRVVRK